MRMSGIEKRGVWNNMVLCQAFPQMCPWICQNGTSPQRWLAGVMFRPTSFITAHYRKPPVCRVQKTLPCAKIRAHGKPSLCRVPTERAHDKHLAHGKHFLCHVSRQKTHGKHPTHGKGSHLPCAAEESTRQRSLVCRAPRLLHTAKLWHTAKLCKKVDFALPIFFLLYIYSVLYSLLKFGIFLVIFAIFSHLISLIEFLGLNWKCFE